MKTKVVFMGTPDFAVPALKALIEKGYDVVCVYSQPPRPAGRGHKVIKSPVHLIAEEHSIEIRTPTSLKSADEQKKFSDLNADIAVVAAYGLLLPTQILEGTKNGCINIHSSILPRWRGAAPIHRAIEAGDKETGVCIMQMDEGLDTGPIIHKREIPLLPRTTGQELHDQLADLGATLLIECLDDYIKGKIKPTAQPSEGITYAKKLKKQEGQLDWTQSADVLLRRLWAFTPWPGVWFEHQGKRFKVIEAKIEEHHSKATPGLVLDDTLSIACGTGVFKPLVIQKEGARPLPVDEFLHGYTIPKGTQL
jgi:methionyl-tRNA formyltransferase